MATEIERKFLVKLNAPRTAGQGQRIRQGYLNKDPDRTIRIRVAGSEAFITIKGRTVGASKSEFEYSIPLQDAEELLRLCVPPLIEKTRFRVLHEGHEWEIDEFHGDNCGLVVAEVELETETEDLVLPDWVGIEVTHNPRYFNSSLSENPYCQWPEKDKAVEYAWPKHELDRFKGGTIDPVEDTPEEVEIPLGLQLDPTGPTMGKVTNPIPMTRFPENPDTEPWIPRKRSCGRSRK